MFAPISKASSEQILGVSNGRNNGQNESARRALCFEDSNKDVLIDEKSIDRKRQNDDLIECLVPAKRFKSN